MLGERYIIARLLRRGNLPKLFGADAFTKRMLRFAWHLTTIAWFGLGALLVAESGVVGHATQRGFLLIVALTFAASELLTLALSGGVTSRGA